ncbi:hypothetical protein J1TS1_17440 [Shouchella clausii]|uniref:hypothetical protein n=1 Tax=Shouchella clausii TaxID=79880 RepID=UPI001B122ADC|nr:hypothetical protein [Shouchella clausii]GIN07599.1 hypothetical protein J1TS1_17440 [Shouchella clausii]
MLPFEESKAETDEINFTESEGVEVEPAREEEPQVEDFNGDEGSTEFFVDPDLTEEEFDKEYVENYFYHLVGPKQVIWDYQKEQDMKAQGDVSVQVGAGAGKPSCTVGKTKVTCKWSLTIVNDKINYSNVKLSYDKRPDWLSPYKARRTKFFRYEVNPAVSTIRNQDEYAFEKGQYRVIMGGNVTGRKAVYTGKIGTYSYFVVD